MLHEVLLALSGYPSPLFGDGNPSTPNKEEFPLISPSEKALLRSIGRLSQLHRKLKQHLETVSSSHRSIICRSVSSSILHTHLARFQKRILDVESKILSKDATLVGAYEIVPLASVVGEFDDWHRRMAWYWQIACFFQPPKDPNREKERPPCTSAQLIDKLRQETHTGFPEIEEAATELAKVAEIAWLKQLSSWIIYGKLPPYGAQDFFIQAEDSDGQVFTKDNDLLPSFVSSTTASSCLFIGKSLHQVKLHRQAKGVLYSASGDGSADAELASSHLSLLSALPLPLNSAQFPRIISEIRLSLSQNVLQQLLPMSLTLQVLSCLRQFFLLARGEFAVALINEAENRIQSRQHSMGKLLQQDPIKAMQNLSIKDAELHQTLQQVWKALAAEDTEDVDTTLEYAQQNITLSTAKIKPPRRPSSSDSLQCATLDVTSTAFNDLLFPSATELGLSFSSPLDLFLSPRDIESYSTISSYLLAIRRSHQKASNLWRRSPARRDHPIASHDEKEARQRNRKRSTAMRKVWATFSAATFLLSETSAFFEGEVIKGACNHFQAWAEKPAPISDANPSTTSTNNEGKEKTAQRDPETLAAGHRTFLASLTHALLLTDELYTKELRTLLGNIDNLVAFFTGLLDIQQRLDGETQDGGEASAHTLEDEQHISLELDRARKKVDSGLKGVVNRLRALDHERIGSLRYLDIRPGEKGDFEIWKGGGGVDRLLMKLEFGRMTEGGRRLEEDDIVQEAVL